MKRIEEFAIEGKFFVYVDLSGIIIADEFAEIMKRFEAIIKKHPENSLYTITNVENTRVDSDSISYMTQALAHNKPYVKCGAVIGFDGIKKVAINTICKNAGRMDMHYAFTKEKAIEWLLKQ